MVDNEIVTTWEHRQPTAAPTPGRRSYAMLPGETLEAWVKRHNADWYAHHIQILDASNRDQWAALGSEYVSA